MDSHIILKNLFIVITSLAGFMDAFFRVRADRKGGIIQTGSQGSSLFRVMQIFSFLFFLSVFLIYIVHEQWISFAAFHVPDTLRFACALVAGFACIPFLFWVFLSLGTNITVTPFTRDGHSLITTGPYSLARHPLYAIGFVLISSLIILSENWLMFVPFLVVYPLVINRIKIEEQNLIETFGDAYLHYMKTTGKLFPRLFSSKK